MKKAANPPVRRRTRLRNDTASLLRSRPLQAVLVIVAGMQVVAVGSGKALHDDQPRTLAEMALRLRTAPVQVMPPVLAEPPAKALKKEHGEAVAAVKSGKKPESRDVAAEELAEKYRDRGYKVSPSLARAIRAAAEANDIPAEVAFGLVRTESGFKNTARSPVGAIGLTQLMPATARLFQRGISHRDLQNPEVNLRIGFRYLRELMDKYDGDTELALTAYNRGPGTVDRVLKRGGDPDNGYAGMVLGRRDSHR
ncbi:lytic transglycosylase domain-containing protein [Longimicrobium sp.]|uniref:lytic transglycosylase domain-containing protein n=1 Tax=Longimicrobium sp. TaxID=2029185 RepID=UPI002C1E180F|nr:transglycosylase SLT domain-containing protein [Longimicrobium sp.]HSU16862.1 transglycosylase SLT domain-containing protein [Longimicrobium sp.]